MQVNDPFFSNDLEGAAKVLGMVATIIAAVWAFIWKMLNNNPQMKTDINEVGRRVNITESDIVILKEKVHTLDTRQSKTEAASAHLEREMVEIRTELRHLAELSSENKVEIIAAFQEKAEEIVGKVHTLENQVTAFLAVQEDRDKRGKNDTR